MDNDRELLEKAAKAVGHEIEWDQHGNCSIVHKDGFSRRDGGRVYEYWEPLEDDGDALRLAVKLSISIRLTAGKGLVNAHTDTISKTARFVTQDAAPLAVRRAIVECAAAHVA